MNTCVGSNETLVCKKQTVGCSLLAAGTLCSDVSRCPPGCSICYRPSFFANITKDIILFNSVFTCPWEKKVWLFLLLFLLLLFLLLLLCHYYWDASMLCFSSWALIPGLKLPSFLSLWSSRDMTRDYATMNGLFENILRMIYFLTSRAIFVNNRISSPNPKIKVC